MAHRIPLFPLELVLFPGVPLPLHIFEPRYKEMVGECLQEKKEFGIIRISSGNVATIGCTASILEVLKRYDDGRLDIMTEGRKRFRLLAVHDDRAFFQADVEYLPEADSALLASDRQQALEWMKRLSRLTDNAESDLDHDHPLLSYQIAGPLLFDLDFRQSLLAERSESCRIKAVADYLAKLVPQLERAIKARSAAGGNGHAVH